ncbi:hypothetical protein ACFPM1_01460 [Halorubrum rubrum]|uniref:DUF7967 domain-containing protein n=1 Tax=Halorubrum rubrum TaxID=1126240 RepID=A0ABD5QXN4_9EURY|nr:hypothetical protein [Halorubrum rubrum]
MNEAATGREDEAERDGSNGDERAEFAGSERTRMWLVERTYSDDEQNMVILTYATPDGAQYSERNARCPRLRTCATRPPPSTPTI